MRTQMLPPDLPSLNLPRPVRAPEPIAPPPSSHEGQGLRRAPTTGRRGWLPLLPGGGLRPGDRAEPERPRDPLLVLVHRITQGYTQEEYERAQALGFEGYLEEQLDAFALDDSALDALLAQNYPFLAMSPREAYDAYSVFTNSPYQQLKLARLTRAVRSRRQLLERMVEFWNDHFNIDHNKGLEWLLLGEHERTVIRPHALGNFGALLSATAFSGAMLYYLDNWLNVAGAPQENYARELLELHSLSVNGGYDEDDVEEVAKCFTGWTLEGDYASPDYLRGKYEPSYHEGGVKKLLGTLIPANPGRDNAQRVLDLVAGHPSTARFLAWKLLRFFVTPNPPGELVLQVANVFRASGGDIKTTLRAVLTRENLSPPIVAPKYRRPMQLVTAGLRALAIRGRAGSLMLEHLAEMGQTPYDHQAPTGYPDTFEAWGDGLLPRWSFQARLWRTDFLWPGYGMPSPQEMLARLDLTDLSDRSGLAGRINRRLLGQTLTHFEERQLQGFIDDYPRAFDALALFDCIGLASSLPGSQWY